MKNKTAYVPTSQKQNNRRERILYAALFSFGLVWTASLWLRSPGASNDDEIGHLLISHDAWRYPHLILEIWGRVVNTLIYMVPALFGLDGARLMSLALACVTVLVTTGLARRLGLKSLYLIPLFLWFQPWFCRFMFTAITTTPFALFLVSAIYLWCINRYVAASLLVGCLPLIRHEGIALLALWFLLVVARRDWRAAAASASPLVVYNVAYFAFITTSISELPVAIYFNHSPTDQWGSGGWFHFVRPVAGGIGLPILAWSIYGLSRLARRLQIVLLLSPYAIYFVLHTILYRFGLYASGGSGSYISPIAPGVAILAAFGAEAAVQYSAQVKFREGMKKLLSRAAVAVLVLVPVVAAGLRSQPWFRRPIELATHQAAGWLTEHYPTRPEKVVATHIWVYYLYGLPYLEYPKLWLPDAHPLDGLPSGTVVVWDKKYSTLLGIPLEELTPDRGWNRLAVFGEGQAMIFRKI